MSGGCRTCACAWRRARARGAPGSRADEPRPARARSSHCRRPTSAAERLDAAGAAGAVSSRDGAGRFGLPAGMLRPPVDSPLAATCVPSVASAGSGVTASPAAAAAPSPCRSECARRPRSGRPSRSCAGSRAPRARSCFRSCHGVVCSRGSGGSWPGWRRERRHGRRRSLALDAVEQPEQAPHRHVDRRGRSTASTTPNQRIARMLTSLCFVARPPGSRGCRAGARDVRSVPAVLPMQRASP